MTFEGVATTSLWTLFGAFGGAMVLLYLLRLRRRRVEVPFSPLWARVVEERQSSALWRRLKHLLSLLVQLAIVGLIVLALGDPRLSGLEGCGYEAPAPPPERHTLLLLDASASMATVERGETRLELARREAHRLVDELTRNPAHRVMLVQVDAVTRPLTLWTTDAQALHAAIDAAAPGGALDTPTGVQAAMALAEAALRDRAQADCVFVTDGAFAPIPAAQAASVRLSVVPVGSAQANVGIAAFNVRPTLDDRLTYAAFYAIDNTTDRPLAATLFLYANGGGRSVEDFISPAHLVASHALALPASGRLEGVLEDLKFPGSRLAARIQIDATDPTRDAFPRDDVAFAIVPERKILDVQLVTEGNLFLQATLMIRENIRLTTRTPAEYIGPEGFDLTVVDSAAVDMTRPGAYFVVNPQPGGPFALEGTLAEPQVARVDRKHPIARHLTLIDLNILEASRVARQRGDAIVAATAGGVPLLFTRVEPGADGEASRRFAVLTFDLKKSLLPMNYAFPLLVVNVLSWFHEEAEGLLAPQRAGVALSLPWPRPRGGAGPSAIAVHGPPGAGPSVARQVADRVHFTVDRVGVYELAAQGQPAQPVAINLADAAESRIAPQESDYPAWAAPEVAERDDDPWLAGPWRLLLLAALAVVLVEWWTWNRRWTV